MAKREQIDILFKMHADLKDMKRMQQETARSKKRLGEMGQMLKRGAGIAIGVTSFGALAGAVKNTTLRMIELGATLHDNARLFGVSAEFLQTWRYAAKQNNVETRQADIALQRFTRRLGEAQAGTGELLPIIEEYGIELQKADGTTRSNVEVLGDFADLLRDTETPTERLRIAFKLFDSEGAALVNTLAGGREGLDEFKGEMEDTGKIIEEDHVEALKRASDAMTSFGETAKGALAGVVAESWSVLEAMMLIQQQATEDLTWRQRARADLVGLDWDELPERGRSRAVSNRMRDRAAAGDPVTNADVEARMEELKTEAIREQIRLRSEKLQQLREERAVAAAAREEAAAAAQREKQEATLRAQIAEYEEQLRWQELSQEEQLAELQTRRLELEEDLQNSLLTEEEFVKIQKEHRDVLAEMVALRAKLDASGPVTTGGGGDTGGDRPSPAPSGVSTGSQDPMANLQERMARLQDPQLIVLASLQGMYEGINDQVQELIRGTITWEQALQNVGGTIVSAVITSFAQMAAAAITSFIATQLGIKAASASLAAADAGAMAEQSKAMAGYAAAAIPAAIATSIINPAAAGTGLAAFLAAMTIGSAGAAVAGGLAQAGMAAIGAGLSGDGGGSGFAAGGAVRGPGGPTSDSIPARLSDGEYVISAKAAGWYGQNLLDNLNAMQVPAMDAEAGLSGISLPSAPATSATASRAKPPRTILVDDRRMAEQLAGDPKFEDEVIKIVRRKRHRLL